MSDELSRCNWLKTVLALNIVRSGIVGFLKKASHAYHIKCIASTCTCNTLDPCDQCFKKIQRNLRENYRRHPKHVLESSFSISNKIRERYWEIVHYYSGKVYFTREIDFTIEAGIDKVDISGILSNFINAKHVGDELAVDNDAFQRNQIDGVNDIFSKVKHNLGKNTRAYFQHLKYSKSGCLL